MTSCPAPPSYGGGIVSLSQTSMTRSSMASGRERKGARLTWAELAAGATLLAGAAVAGLVFVRRPWPNRLDAWGYRVLPADPGASWAHAFVGLGSVSALLGGVLVVFLVGVLRDWVRAVACAIAPVHWSTATASCPAGCPIRRAPWPRSPPWRPPSRWLCRRARDCRRRCSGLWPLWARAPLSSSFGGTIRPTRWAAPPWEWDPCSRSTHS
jgi:hypothetical protein